MNHEERERLVDGMLDRTLGPQAVEPRPGLEQRILANLQAQPATRRWWRWIWVPALAAAAVLAVVFGIRMMQSQPQPPAQAKKTVEQPKQEAATAPPRQAKQVASRAVRPPAPKRALVAAAPRQEVFPTPVPLTEQERLLLALMKRQPEEVQNTMASQQVERERVQKYFATGEAPEAPPQPAQNMR